MPFRYVPLVFHHLSLGRAAQHPEQQEGTAGPLDFSQRKGKLFKCRKLMLQRKGNG